MRTFVAILGALAAIAGVVLLYQGIFRPSRFDLDDASAMQIAQVYSQATYEVAQGTAFLVIALGCTVIAGIILKPSPPAS